MRKIALLMGVLLMFNLPFGNVFACEKKIPKNIPILMYHHIDASAQVASCNTSITTPEKFKKEMIYLQKMGYTTIFFSDVIENKPLPTKPIIITFDDGYYSNYQYAYPILKELGMKATISMIGWSVGRSYNKDNITPIYPHFTWTQAKEMYDSGVIDIQHHSFDLHSYGVVKGVGRLQNESQVDYEKRFTEDTIKMKELIEQNIGNKVTVYTYPYGVYNPTTEKILRKLGFKVSLTVEGGVSNFNDGLYLLKRYNMSYYTDISSLIK